MKLLLLFVAVMASGVLYSQDRPSPAAGLVKHIMPIHDSTGIYVGDGDSASLYYFSGAPKGPVKGVLVLFPPTGQTSEEVAGINAKLITISLDSGILIIIPSINHNLCLDKPGLHFINAVFSDVMKIYRPGPGKFVLGGFSLGGMNAIRYTELAYEDSHATVVRPVAVYGIDPPLDWARMYYSFSRAVEKNFSQPAVNEAKYYLQRLDNEFGGKPEEHADAYIRHSMYSRNSPGGGNARYLRNVPVRIYSDPDIDWQMANRRVDYYDMNVLDGAALINQLHRDGNNRAELINALGKGIRPDGMRHPHSWTLAEPEECLAWIMRCLR